MTSNDHPDDRAPDDPASVVPQRSALEQQIQRIWQEMLQRTEVGVTDRFSALGGDSLTASRMLSQVRRESGVSLSLSEFYEADTVVRLAALVAARIAVQAGVHTDDDPRFERGEI